MGRPMWNGMRIFCQFQQGIFNRANIACQNVMYSGTWKIGSINQLGSRRKMTCIECLSSIFTLLRQMNFSSHMWKCHAHSSVPVVQWFFLFLLSNAILIIDESTFVQQSFKDLHFWENSSAHLWEHIPPSGWWYNCQLCERESELGVTEHYFYTDGIWIFVLMCVNAG